MKIIVVDDEIKSLHVFLDHVVSNTNFEYQFFKDDHNQILTYVKNNEIDGAFLDIKMDNIYGPDLAKELIKIKPEIKIIFITGLNYSYSTLPDDLKKNVIGIIYKPIKEVELSKYLLKMANEKPVLKVRMFGHFDCFMNNELVRFSSNKSKELFALLLTLNGKSLTMEHAITNLWPDKDVDKAKILYRDAIWRLRQTLHEIGFECVDFSRALVTLNKKKDSIECDYWDLLKGKDVFYNYEFCIPYEWSINYESEINYLYEKRQQFFKKELFMR